MPAKDQRQDELRHWSFISCWYIHVRAPTLDRTLINTLWVGWVIYPHLRHPAIWDSGSPWSRQPIKSLSFPWLEIYIRISGLDCGSWAVNFFPRIRLERGGVETGGSGGERRRRGKARIGIETNHLFVLETGKRLCGHPAPLSLVIWCRWGGLESSWVGPMMGAGITVLIWSEVVGAGLVKNITSRSPKEVKPSSGQRNHDWWMKEEDV